MRRECNEVRERVAVVVIPSHLLCMTGGACLKDKGIGFGECSPLGSDDRQPRV
jgi:hypothetical protein